MTNSKVTSVRGQEPSHGNRAFSNGPVSAERKAPSSRSAVKHGCLPTLMTFQTEYLIRFDVCDHVKSDLVDRDWNSIAEQDRRALAYAACIKDSNILGNLYSY